jgi:hypothetical protein
MKKIKPGDVFRLSTENTVAYIHYIAILESYKVEYNHIVYSDHSDTRNFENILENEPYYGLIFPVGLACRKKLIEHVGYVPVGQVEIPRYFALAMRLHENGTPQYYITDVVTMYNKRIEVPDDEFRKLYDSVIPGIELLKHRVNKRWTPADGIENF